MTYGPPGGYGPPPGGYGPPGAPPPGGYGPPGGAPPGYGAPPPSGYGPPGYGAPPMGPPPKKGMSGAAIVLIVLAVAAALFGGGCLMCVCIGAKAGSDAQAEQERLKANAVSVSAQRLIDDYKANEVRADQTWKGKYVNVNGVVAEISKGLGDAMIVNLNSGRQLEFQTIMCHLDEKYKGRAAGLGKGQNLTVRGKVDGLLLLSVQLHDCELR